MSFQVYVYMLRAIYIYKLCLFADAFGPIFERNGALWVLRFCERNLHAYFFGGAAVFAFLEIKHSLI